MTSNHQLEWVLCLSCFQFLLLFGYILTMIRSWIEATRTNLNTCMREFIIIEVDILNSTGQFPSSEESSLLQFQLCSKITHFYNWWYSFSFVRLTSLFMLELGHIGTKREQDSRLPTKFVLWCSITTWLYLQTSVLTQASSFGWAQAIAFKSVSSCLLTLVIWLIIQLKNQKERSNWIISELQDKSWLQN